MVDITLLQNFIIEKLTDYEAPTRRRVPRGERIGFSRPKYAAALFHLYDRSAPDFKQIGGLDQLAKDLRTSADVIRQWRTQPEFRMHITALAFEFYERFCEFTEAAYKTSLQRWDELAAHSPNMIWQAQEVPSVRSELEKNLADASLYGPALQMPILKALVKQMRRAAKANDLSRLSFLSWVIDFLKTPAERSKTRAQTEEVNRIFLEHLLDGLARLLSKPTLSQAERAQAMMALLCLRQEFARHARATDNVGSKNRDRRK
jgi:hypothetical protein